MSTVARPTPPQSPATPHILDNAAWAALTGPHAHLAERVGRAARYPLDVSPFTALADPADPRAWDDLAALVGPGTVTPVTGTKSAPQGWETVQHGQGVQLVDTALRAEPAPEAVRLGPDDVPEILDLIALTEPGPFLPRTVELGTYLGIRHRGRLIALAGERSEMGSPGRRLGEAATGRLDGDQRGLHRPGPPRQGPGHATGPRDRGRHQGARGHALPACLRDQHRRDPALRVDRLHPAPPLGLPPRPNSGRPAGTDGVGGPLC